MEVENITKAATFKTFLHVIYKNTELLFFATALFNIHMRNNNRWLLRVTQKYDWRVSFKFGVRND